MFGLVVRFDLRPESVAAFDRLVDEMLVRIRAEEPGTLVYVCHHVDGEPVTRIFYELYRDRPAFELHERQSHVQHFFSNRAQFLTAPPRVEWLRPRVGKGLPGAQPPPTAAGLWSVEPGTIG